MGIHVLGTGSYTPAFQVTNEDMAKIVETNDEWIRTRTGIGTRHISDGEPTWYMGAQAAKRAIEAAGIDPLEIGLLIDTTITPEYCTPSMSCIIQRETGAANAACFDMNAACSGFVYAMDTAHRFLKTDPTMRYALVVANESLSKITNYNDRSSVTAQQLRSSNTRKMRCTPAIWAQTAPAQSSSMPTAHCLSLRS